MNDKSVKIITMGDMNAVYIISSDGCVSFSAVPAEHKTEPLWEKGGADPLIQVSCTGDSSCLGFSAGQTRHDSGLTMSMRFVSQEVREEKDLKKIITIAKAANGIKLEHTVSQKEGSRSLSVSSKIVNGSQEVLMTEAISSVCLSGITPYANDEATGRLVMHRFRSRWSAEGRHEACTIEDLMLEPSWAGFGVRCEKFGAVGSMPVRGFFPFVAIEDTGADVTWAVSLSCSSSWQMELVRMDENLSITGGLADYEFGHWRRSLAPGETFVAPEAFITVASADIDMVCDRLLDVQRERLSKEQRSDRLPLIFNEYCTTWGEPSEKNIDRILPFLKGKGYEYFVIDAGWYADEICGWQDNMGDWNVAGNLFPHGLKPVVEKINAEGMKAGIWFELEVVGKDAKAADDKAHLLTRDGKVIVSGTRRFWDMRKEWVKDYLTEKVIDLLNDNGFEYIKIDYNDTIGIGCDGADSYGEGLREVMEATREFFAKIREKVKGIAIEICSSGGHRLEPGFMQLADYLSFSDAHEEKEIPVIALDLQRLILPSKSQIWSVLRKNDSPERIVYSICAGMYGVLCISGDVYDLSEEQWKTVQAGTDLYRKATPVIAKGVTKRFGPFQKSNRALKGYQASVRYGNDKKALVIVHSFKHDGMQKIEIPLEGKYRIADIYEASDHGITIADDVLSVKFEEEFDAVAILLE